MDPRVVKPQTPVLTIVLACLIGAGLLAFIIFSVAYSGHEIQSAKKTGTIVSKEFTPAPEEQITLGKSGSIATRKVDGDYVITVDVPEAGGMKTYSVYMPTKESYDKLKVGDKFDVGPYLVKEKK